MLSGVISIKSNFGWRRFVVFYRNKGRYLSDGCVYFLYIFFRILIEKV